MVLQHKQFHIPWGLSDLGIWQPGSPGQVSEKGPFPGQHWSAKSAFNKSWIKIKQYVKKMGSYPVLYLLSGGNLKSDSSEKEKIHSFIHGHRKTYRTNSAGLVLSLKEHRLTIRYNIVIKWSLFLLNLIFIFYVDHMSYKVKVICDDCSRAARTVKLILFMYKQYSATFEILAEMETKQVKLHYSSVDLVSFIYIVLIFWHFVFLFYLYTFFFYITNSV